MCLGTGSGGWTRKIGISLKFTVRDMLASRQRLISDLLVL